jgi:hypothetical protein
MGPSAATVESTALRFPVLETSVKKVRQRALKQECAFGGVTMIPIDSNMDSSCGSFILTCAGVAGTSLGTIVGGLMADGTA